MQDKTIENLKNLLRGEEMAVQAYERLIQVTEDTAVKNQLQSIQRDHKKHSADLAERIQTLGGTPRYDTGFTGFMAGLTAAVENAGTKNAADILKRAYDGEDQGIAMAEKIAKDGLDPDSARLVNSILSTDHDHLKTMSRMISEYGNIH